jgi:hypothetical protein
MAPKTAPMPISAAIAYPTPRIRLVIVVDCAA